MNKVIKPPCIFRSAAERYFKRTGRKCSDASGKVTLDIQEFDAKRNELEGLCENILALYEVGALPGKEDK